LTDYTVHAIIVSVKIKRAYKYRIYPTRKQEEQIAKQFGASRFVYNHFLRKRIDFYAETGKTLVYHDTALQLTKLKKQPDYTWLKDADSQVLQQSLRDLDTAYSNFFNKHSRFPTFKRKHDRQACRFPQRFRIEGNRLYVPKVGLVRIILHRPTEGKMKNLTISKTKSGKYFASIQVEQDIPEPFYEGTRIGLDLGLRDFAVASDGQRFANPKHLIKSERKLKRLQRKFNRAQPGSHGREKARIKVAKQHERVANQRKDSLHKLSRKMVEDNQLIIIEDLNVKGMTHNHCLAKAIFDAGWAEFTRQLSYKGQWYGCHIEKIDRFFPSSKRCTHCGFINQGLKLSDREWVCPECGCLLDRDLNAAQNILNWYTVGTTEINAVGQTVNPTSVGSSG
jgi:putative transposase